ncbi:hypothetical protein BC830DRAFT_1171046 [Chytriomyces sp. MP71]|nr:hypothetical protein BC830DRAFT_1171046 [Chytriomyces sp. MP71]
MAAVFQNDACLHSQPRHPHQGLLLPYELHRVLIVVVIVVPPGFPRDDDLREGEVTCVPHLARGPTVLRTVRSDEADAEECDAFILCALVEVVGADIGHGGGNGDDEDGGGDGDGERSAGAAVENEDEADQRVNEGVVVGVVVAAVLPAARRPP